jgi:three-Cys-motif partner protein
MGLMKKPRLLEFDEIGYWSEVKLSILEEYARPYNQILRSNKLTTVYIDAFAGAGHHIAKGSREIVRGSPMRALTVQPPFDMLHFVDMDNTRTNELKRLSIDYPNVTVHSGDANIVLPRDVYPHVRFDQYRRGLCILDPYGLHLDWNVICGAGESRSIEIFLNFPVMDMNMNVLWHDVEKVSVIQRERMTRFWGDDSWRQAAYTTEQNLFGPYIEKGSNDDVAAAFRNRLKDVAGFRVVPEPIPMRNTTGAIVYYLFFAAHKPIASDIVTAIFNKYRNRGEKHG